VNPFESLSAATRSALNAVDVSDERATPSEEFPVDDPALGDGPAEVDDHALGADPPGVNDPALEERLREFVNELPTEPVEPEGEAPDAVPVELGLDLHTGEPIRCDAARIGHALVVGTTGSGKSVFVNNLVVQLLALPPQQVGLVLIDPKFGVELGVFDSAPHLLCPLIEEPSRALAVLRQVVRFMECRYKWLRTIGLRSVAEVEEGLLDPRYLFVVIEELAELSMQEKEIWGPVTRLVQKGRAAGVILVCVSQQNSVKIMPSVVLANLPSRVALKVTSSANALMAVQQLGPEKFIRPGEFLIRSPALADVRVGRTNLLSSAELKGFVAQARSAYPQRIRGSLSSRNAFVQPAALAAVLPATGEHGSDGPSCPGAAEIHLPVRIPNRLRSVEPRERISNALRECLRFPWMACLGLLSLLRLTFETALAGLELGMRTLKADFEKKSRRKQRRRTPRKNG